VRVAARLSKEPQVVRRWLGLTLIAQAGAAIGLVQVAAERNPALGAHLQTIVIGTVIFFEVLGPIMTRTAIIRAGEVPVAQLVQPFRLGWVDLGKAVLAQIRHVLGGDPWKGRPHDSLQISDLMRQNARSIPSSDDFLHVLEFIESSRHHVYPVVDEAGKLVGVIHYHDVRSTLFHPELAALVRAEDLCHPARWIVYPDQSIDDAFAIVEKTSDDLIPVVAAADDLSLVGIIERRDVVRFVKHRYHMPKD
jgi:CBS domain-containing protein